MQSQPSRSARPAPARSAQNGRDLIDQSLNGRFGRLRILHQTDNLHNTVSLPMAFTRINTPLAADVRREFCLLSCQQARVHPMSQFVHWPRLAPHTICGLRSPAHLSKSPTSTSDVGKIRHIMRPVAGPTQHMGYLRVGWCNACIAGVVCSLARASAIYGSTTPR